MAFAVFNSPVKGLRPQGGEYQYGVWAPQPMVPISILSSIQPTKDSDLELLPEGRRAGRSYTFYSKTQVLEEDIFFVYGEAYEVLHVAVWQNRILPHYKAIAVKMAEMVAPPEGPVAAGAFTFGSLTFAGEADWIPPGNVFSVGALTFQGLRIEGTAGVGYDSVGAFSFGNLQVSGVAANGVSAAGNVVFGAFSFAGAAAVEEPQVAASGAFTFGNLQVSGAGSVAYEATGSFQFAAMTFAGAAEVLGITNANGAFSFGALDFSGAATVEIPASGAFTFGALAFEGEAAAEAPGIVAASGAVTFGNLAFAGAADVEAPVVSASGAFSFGALAFAGAAAYELSAVGAFAFGSLEVAGSAAVGYDAAGAFSFGALTVEGAASVAAPGVNAAGAFDFGVLAFAGSAGVESSGARELSHVHTQRFRDNTSAVSGLDIGEDVPGRVIYVVASVQGPGGAVVNLNGAPMTLLVEDTLASSRQFSVYKGTTSGTTATIGVVTSSTTESPYAIYRAVGYAETVDLERNAAIQNTTNADPSTTSIEVPSGGGVIIHVGKRYIGVSGFVVVDAMSDSSAAGSFLSGHSIHESGPITIDTTFTTTFSISAKMAGSFLLVPS